MISSFPSMGLQVLQRRVTLFGWFGRELGLGNKERVSEVMGFVVLLPVSLRPACLKVPCRVMIR